MSKRRNVTDDGHPIKISMPRLRQPTTHCLAALCATSILLQAAAPLTAQERFFPSEQAERDEIETDRDSFTFATSTAGPRRTIVETSYSFIDNRVGPESHSLPELLVRRGFGDWFEARLGWNYEAGGPGTASGNEFGGEDLVTETEAKFLYGGKFKTSTQQGLRPASAFIVQGYTPTAGPANTSSIVAGEAFGWTLPNGWVWDTAMRYASGNERGDSFAQWAPSTVLKIPVGERWSVHAEYFGIMSSGKETPIQQHFSSFGGHVLVKKNLELGIRFGFGINQEAPRFFNNIGVGWRF